MRFCEECFVNGEIISMISSNKRRGHCDLVASHKNVWVCDTEQDTETTKNIRNFLRQIIDIYSLESDLPCGFPESKKDLLRNSLKNKSSLFRIDSSQIHNLLHTLFDKDPGFNSFFLVEKIGVPEEHNTSKELLIIQENKWENFVESIQYSNRFHSNSINLNKLKYFL